MGFLVLHMNVEILSKTLIASIKYNLKTPLHIHIKFTEGYYPPRGHTVTIFTY